MHDFVQHFVFCLCLLQNRILLVQYHWNHPYTYLWTTIILKRFDKRIVKSFRGTINKSYLFFEIFLTMFSALRFSVPFSSISLLLISDFACFRAITNVDQMSGTKNQNKLSLKQKDCDADGCFILHQDERWMLYVFNLLILQHHFTYGDAKSLRWWCYQRMHLKRCSYESNWWIWNKERFSR